MNPVSLPQLRLPARTALAAALGICCAAGAQTQAQPSSAKPAGDTGRFVSPVDSARAAAAAPQVMLGGAYAANAKVGAIDVEISAAALVADGRAPVVVNVKLLDRQGRPVQGEALITIENSGGMLQLPGAESAQFGPANGDADRSVPGLQLKVVNGAASFTLLAPNEPGDVQLRITAGEVYAQGVLSFEPHLRDMIAAGLVEGAIRLSKENAARFSQARLEDGFEQEIKRFSRDFSGGKGQVAARAALFLQGQISGESLLTLAYDSDKETRARLLRDVKPEQMYPVYGDASVQGFAARSSDRLYVRVDRGRNYVLYGDFATGDGFALHTGAGVVASEAVRQLGAYNRTLTGVRGHLENSQGFVNAFASRDTLKQVVEEYAGNGTSGPFAVRNASALENSEKIEIITRDKNARDKVLGSTVLQRLVDYSFEPFNGRIVLARPLPSLDPNGNPLSLRISYEVDQGGEAYWLAGLDGQVNLGDRFSVGAAYLKDKNPLSPYELASANATLRLGDNTSVIAEVAQSASRAYALSAGAVPSVFPTGAAGESALDRKGKAVRMELQHRGKGLQVKAWALASGAGFDNPNSGLLGNRLEAGAFARQALGESVSLNVQAQRTQDRGTDARRDAASVGAEWKASDRLSLVAGLRKINEAGSLGVAAAFTQTPVAPGSSFNNVGGFAGNGPGHVIDPATGLPSVNSNTSAATSFTPSTAGASVDATTAFVGARWGLGDKLSVSGLAEAGLSGTAGNERPARYELGASYQLAERTRAYVRGETQTGLAAATSLNPGDRSHAVLAGLENSYADGQALFSEYRLRDAVNGQDAQWATGLRNTWQWREGLRLASNAEYLKVFNAAGSGASGALAASDAYALGLGMDYAVSPLWKSSWKLDWRHVNDNASTPTSERSDSVLASLMLARKLDRDWTLLARNYALVQRSEAALGSASAPPAPGTSSSARAWQNRAQLGAAYRPVDNTRFDGLMRLEYKVESNINHQDEFAKTWVASAQGVWHPSRPWWLNARVAAKQVRERFMNNEGAAEGSFRAALLGGRLIYDVTERWDVGLLASVLQGRSSGQVGSSRQWAVGVETGYALAANLWGSVGYNVTGFNDKDLAANDYTNRGFFLRLRFKFDEDLLRGGSTAVNRSLPRP